MNRIENNGFYEVVWNGRNNNGSRVAPGTYIYKIQTPDYVDAKATIIKIPDYELVQKLWD